MSQLPTLPAERPASDDPPAPGDFRLALRSFAGAVTIVAAGEPGQRSGLTATAVCSVTDDPPTMLACINLKASASSRISEAGCFSINVLAERHREIAQKFAGRQGLGGEDRFSGADWAPLITGAPALRDALAVLDCRLVDARTVGTHTIFIGTVAAIRVGPAGPALLYAGGGFHALSG